MVLAKETAATRLHGETMREMGAVLLPAQTPIPPGRGVPWGWMGALHRAGRHGRVV
jgi:hypothetical protein